MMVYNAYVTVDADHRLTAGSTVVVCGPDGQLVASAPVPARAEVGGVMFWPRTGTALATIGWRVVHIRPGRPDPGFSEDEPGVVRFAAEPKES
ncbi:hypothetical protein ABT369_39630 [Dactylosporangium sp. NPDC000244]|uniref:hypothetical protein n=1 Tax=Dactylosporangium sp. NPDC000244 TaxID=3154365 RepID=UPI00331F7F48